MSPTDAHGEIFKRWLQLWHTLAGGTQAAPTVPYSLENNTAPQGASRFACVEITPLDGEQATIGPPPGRGSATRKWLRPGWIDVRLYGPPNEGRKPLDTLAGYVATMFQGVRFGGGGADRGIVTYATSSSVDRGNKQFPNLYCLLVRTPFDYYERS